MKTSRILSCILALVLLLSLAACGTQSASSQEESVPVSKIDLDSSELALHVGETATITAAVNLKATNKDLVWTTSDETVATVDNGIITAAAAGEAIITATAADGSGVSASCIVTVTELGEVIMTVPQDGDHPEPDDVISGDIRFFSDGNCAINAFYAGFSAQLSFETTYSVQDGVLSFGEPVAVEVMGIGGTVATTSEVNGENVTVVCTVIEQDVRCCTFTLTAEQIAQFGLAVGEKTAVESISLPETKEVVSGEVFSVSGLVAFTPADATIQDITITVDDSNADSQVVYVESENIYPLKAGTVTITVSSVDNPEASAVMTLSVKAVERPENLGEKFFDTDRSFAWALNGYVFKTDGSVDILDSAGILQVLGYYSLSEDGTQITLYALNEAAANVDYNGQTYNLTAQAGTELLQFDIGEPLGAPGMYIAVEIPAA